MNKNYQTRRQSDFLPRVWKILPRIKTVHIHAVDYVNHCRDDLIGAVTVKSITEKTLLMREQGVWRRRQIQAENNYQWHWQDDLFLSHLRYGQQHQVRLACFSVGNARCRRQTRSVSEAIHCCGSDQYHATLTLTSKLCLRWQIIGSNKHSMITAIYHSDEISS
ncbi:MAG: DUF6314 family protein [Pseudomonadota bacterium]